MTRQEDEVIQEPERTDTEQSTASAVDADIVGRMELALGALTDADLVRIARKAGYLAGGMPDDDGMALFNEAIMRTLDGSRNWPLNLPFQVYVFGAMRSIVHGQRQSRQAECETLEGDLSVGEEDVTDAYFEGLHGAGGTDELLIARAEMLAQEAMLQKLREHFKGEENVELVLAALEDGTPRRVLIEEFGMTTVEYESARKKLRRGADVLFRRRSKT